MEVHYKAPGARKPIEEFMIANFPRAQLAEERWQRLTYRLPSDGAPLSRIFGAMEKEKARLDIDEYSVSQSTLEQVFLSFAKRKSGAAASA